MKKQPKLHECPGCGRSHTGFTEKCGDCLVAPSKSVARRIAAQTNVTTNVTPDTDVTIVKPPTNVTKRGFGSGKGRPREHKGNAVRQAAYRGRQ